MHLSLHSHLTGLLSFLKTSVKGNSGEAISKITLDKAKPEAARVTQGCVCSFASKLHIEVL